MIITCCLLCIDMHCSDKDGNTVVDVDIETDSDLGSFDPETLKQAIENALKKLSDGDNIGGFPAAPPDEDSFSVSEPSLGRPISKNKYFYMSILVVCGCGWVWEMMNVTK